MIVLSRDNAFKPEAFADLLLLAVDEKHSDVRRYSIPEYIKDVQAINSSFVNFDATTGNFERN